MRDRTEFSKGGVASGGVTGSIQVTGPDNKKYQLKPSIKDNTAIRQLKAKRTERENFSEVIASHIARMILTAPGAIPEIFLVYDKIEKKVSIASKYLEGDNIRTMDAYAEENGISLIVNGKKKHLKIIAVDASAKQGELNIDSHLIEPLKETLAEGLAGSAIWGNHDVNPDNMIVRTDKGVSTISCIDLGHSLNDLLNAPGILGGHVLNKTNPVKDFINRKKVAGIKGGDESKLRRDYPGLVFSHEMADALIKTGSTTNEAIKTGVDHAKQAFRQLFRAMDVNNDDKGKKHVHKSLLEIYNNISDKKIDLSSPMADQFDAIFEGVETFICKNCDNAVKVGHLMKAQLIINESLAVDVNIEEIKQRVEIESKFIPREKTEWIRETNESKPVRGTLEDYIHHKKVEILHKKDPKNALNNTANNILNFIDNYRDRVTDQKRINTKGIEKLDIIESQLHLAVGKINQGDIGAALQIVKVLKRDLNTKYGEKNILGTQSKAYVNISKIEQSLVNHSKNNTQSYKQSVQSIRDDGLMQEENMSASSNSIRITGS